LNGIICCLDNRCKYSGKRTIQSEAKKRIDQQRGRIAGRWKVFERIDICVIICFILLTVIFCGIALVLAGICKN